MDDSKKSVTAGARGEFTMTSDQRPTERTYSSNEPPPAPPPSAPRRPRRVAFACAAAVAGLLAALLAAAPVAAQTDVWTATLTPADFGSGLLGCNNASATSKCSTATVLSDDDFTYDSTDYSVTTLYLNATAFTLTVDTDITDATNALTVVVGSTSLAFADATQTARTRTWFNPGFSWTAGTAVSIRIPDTTPPELTSAAVAADGNSITVTFDESVDQTNLPAAGAFSVAADGAPVTVSGVSAGTAAQLVLALAAPGIRAGQVVTLGYTDPTDGDDTSAVQDTSGNDAVSFSDYSVTNNSIVVTVPSDWSLKPTGLAVGDQFRLLFLSSTKRDGSSSDIADYHAFIQTRAAAGHADIRTYSTGFRAVGCTADTDARDTTYTTYTSTDKGVPIYWLNGAKAADQYEDFYDGTWDDEANDKNESGTNGPNTSLEANYPLTGCNDDGTEYFDRFDRSSALAKIEVMVGRPNSSAAASHGPLSSNTALDVSNTVTRPMYGLSAIFQVAADTTPPTLTSADVEETNGLTIYLEFSEDLQLSNPPLASAFTLTVDGSAVTGFSVALPGSLLPQNAIWLRPPTAIRQGQAVVVTYTDPTAGNDTAAIQDTTGNDAADFTTGMNSVPAVINNSTVANAVLAGWSLTPTGLAAGDQVPAAVPLLHQARRHRHGYRDLQHLHTDPRRGRPRRHPSLQRGLQGGRLHRRHRRPRQHRDHVHQHRQGRPHLLAQRRQGRRRVRGFLRRVLGRRGQRQERVRHRRARYLPDRQLALDRLQPRRHRVARVLLGRYRAGLAPPSASLTRCATGGPTPPLSTTAPSTASKMVQRPKTAPCTGSRRSSRWPPPWSSTTPRRARRRSPARRRSGRR